MAANKDTGNLYPYPYNEDGFFSKDEILDEHHMNFIAKNLNEILKILSWNGIIEIPQPNAEQGQIPIFDET